MNDNILVSHVPAPLSRLWLFAFGMALIIHVLVLGFPISFQNHTPSEHFSVSIDMDPTTDTDTVGQQSLSAPTADGRDARTQDEALSIRPDSIVPVPEALTSEAVVPLDFLLPPELKTVPLMPDTAQFSEHPSVAFDESKITAAPPKNAYLSDRNSTAADRGPKNLPRGDPYLDKGQSTEVRYLQTRGEGNLPPLASSPSGGSVKKEGSPDFASAAKSVTDQSLRESVVVEGVNESIMAKGMGVSPTPITNNGLNNVAGRPSVSQPQGSHQQVPEACEPLPNSRGTDTKRIVQELSPLIAEGVGDTPVRHEVSPTPIPLATMDSITSRVSKPEGRTADEELRAFASLIDGTRKLDANPGENRNDGTSPRPGQRGHEGDGSLKPGDDNAVSDVTSINFESSAQEFDEARFAKLFDPKTAYIKPLARRIDNKWKAEIVARNRARVLRGVITIKAVIRRDGTLLEATEVRRSPDGIPDEYAAIAKVAIQRAADPTSEPFPPALTAHEKLEFTFNFLY